VKFKPVYSECFLSGCPKNLYCAGSDPPHCWLHLIVVRRFEYASDPESYTSSSVATGRAYLAGQVKG